MFKSWIYNEACESHMPCSTFTHSFSYAYAHEWSRLKVCSVIMQFNKECVTSKVNLWLEKWIFREKPNWTYELIRGCSWIERVKCQTLVCLHTRTHALASTEQGNCGRFKTFSACIFAYLSIQFVSFTWKFVVVALMTLIYMTALLMYIRRTLSTN